jgi:hypothetical protein
MTAVVTMTDAGGGKTLYRAVALHKNQADRDVACKYGLRGRLGQMRRAA